MQLVWDAKKFCPKMKAKTQSVIAVKIKKSLFILREKLSLIQLKNFMEIFGSNAKDANLLYIKKFYAHQEIAQYSTEESKPRKILKNYMTNQRI